MHASLRAVVSETGTKSRFSAINRKTRAAPAGSLWLPSRSGGRVRITGTHGLTPGMFKSSWSHFTFTQRDVWLHSHAFRHNPFLETDEAHFHVVLRSCVAFPILAAGPKQPDLKKTKKKILIAHVVFEDRVYDS